MLLVTVLFLFWSGLVWSHVDGHGYGTVDDYSLYYSRLKIASGSLFLFAFWKTRSRALLFFIVLSRKGIFDNGLLGAGTLSI